jgi:hypothetical protein
MRSDITQIVLVLCTALAGACSSTPHGAEPALGTAAQPKQAPQALAAAANAPATAPVTASATARAPSSEVDRSLVNAGYSVQRRHDEIFYCRNEIITGNRIGTRVCLTAVQIQNEKQDVTKSKDLINKPNNRCMGPECK